jgi:DNA-binding FrmR family transcriptional regulator
MPTAPSDVIRRLHCAEGNLSAVIDMIENRTSSARTLCQLLAVTAAVHATGTKMILCQVRSSQKTLLNSPSYEERNTALKELQLLYTILLYYSNHHYEVFHD